uniref:Vang-like protein n=1 Tax=Steinernema glaseri TaxID=37863 RepID=A0A1I7Y453_9BILA
MSVVSDRSTRRSSQKQHSRSRGIQKRYGSEIEHQMMIPQFSAAGSEGVCHMDMDDTWGDNTTVITTTSDFSQHGGNALPYFEPSKRVTGRRCSRVLWLCSAVLLCLIAIGSAPLMMATPLLLPYIGIDWPEIECPPDCQGYVLTLCVKVVLLIVALWAVYWRSAAADMPRIFLPRVALAFFVLFILFAFWLFFIVRIVLERQAAYSYIVSYSTSLLDVLLYVHYISVIVLVLRSLRPEFTVSVLRDPDGELHTFPLGMMSLQEAAVQVLRFYNVHFSSFNPALEAYRTRTKSCASTVSTGFKMYDIDGTGAGTLSEENARAVLEAAARRKTGGHNERLYEEQEWENRLRKRQYRLLGSTEDAFYNVQSIYPIKPNGQASISDPVDIANAAKSAQALIQRSLMKYLRAARKQSLHPPDQVLQHIENCLTHNLSPRTFLNRFTCDRMPLQPSIQESKWSIVCDRQASGSISHGLTFVLRSHNQNNDSCVQLVCTVSALPFFNITEQSSSKRNFSVKVNGDLVC